MAHPTAHQGQNIDDIFAEEEARLLAEVRPEIAAEKAAWDAMSDAEKAAAIEEMESRLPDTAEADQDDEDEESDDEDEWDA